MYLILAALEEEEDTKGPPCPPAPAVAIAAVADFESVKPEGILQEPEDEPPCEPTTVVKEPLGCCHDCWYWNCNRNVWIAGFKGIFGPCFVPQTRRVLVYEVFPFCLQLVYCL